MKNQRLYSIIKKNIIKKQTDNSNNNSQANSNDNDKNNIEKILF